MGLAVFWDVRKWFLEGRVFWGAIETRARGAKRQRPPKAGRGGGAGQRQGAMVRLPQTGQGKTIVHNIGNFAFSHTKTCR